MSKANFLKLLLLLVALSYIYTIYLIVTIPHQVDYHKFYQSAQNFFQGQSLYADTIIDCIDRESSPPVLSKNVRAPNLNPPFFTLLVIPFAKFNYHDSLTLWISLSLLTLLVSVQWLKKMYDLSAVDTLLLLLGLLSYFPVMLNILTGQVSLWLLLLLAGAWLALHKKQDWLAGSLFGVLINIKIFFGLFFVFFLVMRKWRVLTGFLITAALCALLALAIFGTTAYGDYNHKLTQIYWYSSNWNGSIYGWLVRVFGANEQNTPLWHYPAYTTVFYYLFIAVLISLYWVLAKRSGRDFHPESWEWGFSVTLVSMLLISPLGWNYYFPILIIPVLSLLKTAQTHRYGDYVILLVSAALLLSAIPSQLLEPIQINKPLVILLGSSYYCYALLLLLAALLVVIANPTAINQQYNLPKQLTGMLFIVALLPSIIGNYATIINTEKFLNNPNTDLSIMGCVKSRNV